TASNALAIDGVTLFIQGTILVLAALSVLLIAERGVEAGSAIVACGGGGRLAGRSQAGQQHPGADRGLPADAVRGRRHADLPGRQQPAADVRRAGSAVAAAVPDGGPGPPAPAAQPGGGAEVLPARGVRLGVLPVRDRAAVRLCQLGGPAGHPEGTER